MFSYVALSNRKYSRSESNDINGLTIAFVRGAKLRATAVERRALGRSQGGLGSAIGATTLRRSAGGAAGLDERGQAWDFDRVGDFESRPEITAVRFDALDLRNFVFGAMSCAKICLVSI